MSCDSNIYSEFFRQISQICHNLLSLEITIGDAIPDGVADIISIQRNLKYLSIFNYYSKGENLLKIIPSIANIPNNLIKLHIVGGGGTHTVYHCHLLLNLQIYKNYHY